MAADGQILIDTKIRTDGAKQETQNLKSQLERLAESASASAKKIDKSFSDIDLEDAADGLGESFEEAWDDVKRDSTHGADHIKDKLDDIGDEAAGAGDRIRSGLKGIFDGLSAKLGDGFVGGLIGGMSAGLAEAAFGFLSNAGEKLVELGKQAVAASAEVQASNAQFAQTFKGVEEAARSSLGGIADETGILATRMQSSYTRIFAFLKTLGADTSTALDLSGRAMTAAADSAAYYDKSIEEVTETLQSFLKGNYENDAALGISATETTRNAKANEKYAKSFQKLTEAQKVDVLLSMVEAGNELSGALGQAAREADNWENVTGNLSESWKQFLAVLGAPIIAALVPLIKGATSMLTGLTDALTWIGQRASDLDLLSLAFQGVSADIDTAAMSAGVFNNTLYLTGEQAAETANGVSALTEMEQELALAAEQTATSVQMLRDEYDAAKEAAHDSLLSQVGYFDELTVKSDKSAADIVANWGKQREAFDQYAANMQKAIQLGLDETLVAQLSDGSQQSMAILHELVNSTDLNVREINAAFAEVQESRETVESTMAAIETNMADKLEELAGNVAEEWGTMAYTVGSSISEMQDYINSLEGKDVYVNVITRALFDPGVNRGGNSGSSGGAVDFNSYAMPRSIPYLASGAVIPPNAPFAAVLGDQKHGTNIEAPLATIQEAVAAVLGDMIPAWSSGFEAMTERQDELIAAVREIQIGDTTIGRAAARYDRRQNLIRGGSTG